MNISLTKNEKNNIKIHFFIYIKKIYFEYYSAINFIYILVFSKHIVLY